MHCIQMRVNNNNSNNNNNNNKIIEITRGGLSGGKYRVCTFG